MFERGSGDQPGVGLDSTRIVPTDQNSYTSSLAMSGKLVLVAVHLPELNDEKREEGRKYLLKIQYIVHQ